MLKLLKKIFKSWWVILSLLPSFNGLGLIYLGCRSRNKSWIIEGIAYEVPWIFAISNAYSPNIFVMAGFAVVFWFMSIIRSFWLAFLFMDAYD